MTLAISSRGGLLLAALACCSTVAQAADTTLLPLKRVRLYETGVGYFERSGKLGTGGQGVSLPVPAAHLDDALKTLVVLSKDSKSVIDGIEFGSSVSRNMAQALAGLEGAGGDARLGYAGVVGSMKGARVEIKSGRTTLRGRLVEVMPASEEKRCETPKDGAKAVCVVDKDMTLMLLASDGAMHRFRSRNVASIRPLDPAWQSRFGSALDSLSQGASGSASKLRVLAKGSGSISLGYVAETPVWRSSYRLVLDDTGAGGDVLQGWALLHNDTSEDWKQVQLELVNGLPDSFLFPLAAPRYARRKLVTPQHELSTVPQLLGKTVDNMWSVDGGLGLSGVGEGGGGRGEGIGLGSIGTIGHGSGHGRIVNSASGSSQSTLLGVGNLAKLAASEGVEAGAQFRYALPRRIDLSAHHSALVPFASAQVKVERMVHFAGPGLLGRSGVYLTNNTKQTLPAGTVAVFSGGGFSGESALPRTKPGEKRVVRFGTDPDVKIEYERGKIADESRFLRFRRGDLEKHFSRTHNLRYTVINRSGAARKAFIVLPFSSKADVKGAPALRYDSERKQPLAVFPAQARSKEQYALSIREGLVERYEESKITVALLTTLAAQKSLPASQRALLREAVGHFLKETKAHPAALRLRVRARELTDDIRRIRTNIKVIKGSSKHAGKLVEALLKAEGRRKVLRNKARRRTAFAEAQGKLGMAVLRRLNRESGSGAS